MKEKDVKVKTERNEKEDHNNYLWIAVIAIMGLIMSIFIKSEDELWNNILIILQGVSISALAGVILTKFVDIPKRFSDYTKLITTSLTSYDFLKQLKEEDLQKLREKVTTELYMEKAPKMPQGLIKLDSKVCDLVNNPYYYFYRESIECDEPKNYRDLICAESKIVNDFDASEDAQKPDSGLNESEIKDENEVGKKLFVRKNNYQVYTINNPFAGVKKIEANIGLNNYVYIPKGCSLEQLFQIKQFQLSIDNGEFVDIMPLLEIVYHTHKKTDVHAPETTTYNTGFHLVTKDGNIITSFSLLNIKPSEVTCKEAMGNIGEPKLSVSFSDNVRVKLNYTLIVPEDDNHFTKRLKYTTKSYRLDYSIADKTQRLTGQLFGTLIDQSQIEINESVDDNSISIEAFEWLLPKSGAFVVSSKK